MHSFDVSVKIHSFQEVCVAQCAFELFVHLGVTVLHVDPHMTLQGSFVRTQVTGIFLYPQVKCSDMVLKVALVAEPLIAQWTLMVFPDIFMHIFLVSPYIILLFCLKTAYVANEVALL